MLVSVPAKSKPIAPAAGPGTFQLNLRATDDLIKKLDKWLAELNRDRRVPLTRAELMRGVLDWGAENRPDWEKR